MARSGDQAALQVWPSLAVRQLRSPDLRSARTSHARYHIHGKLSWMRVGGNAAVLRAFRISRTKCGQLRVTLKLHRQTYSRSACRPNPGW